MVYKAIILALAILAGCSATKEIASSASIASGAAHSIYERAEYIAANSTQPEIVAAAVIVRTDAAVILHESEQIINAVTGVKDIVPIWASVLQYLLFAIIAVAVVVFIWQTGIGTAIRVAIGWLPRKKVMEADLARQAMNDADPTTMREYVAARRASDPLFNAAFQKEKEGGK